MLFGFIICLKAFCSVSSSLWGLCFRKQFEAKGILLLQSRLLYLREAKADCLCKSHWFSCTWCLLLFFFFFLDKCYFDKFSLAGLLEEEALYLSLLYIHDLFFSKSTSGVVPSLLSNSIKFLMVIYISFNCFLELMLGSSHNQLSERKLIFQKVLKL